MALVLTMKWTTMVALVMCCGGLLTPQTHALARSQRMQLKELQQLEADLLALAKASLTEREHLVERMTSSRQLLHAMFQHEDAETKLYLKETRLKMVAIRDVLQLEMEKATREIHDVIRAAKDNVTMYARQVVEMRRERLNKHSELQQRREALAVLQATLAKHQSLMIESSPSMDDKKSTVDYIPEAAITADVRRDSIQTPSVMETPVPSSTSVGDLPAKPLEYDEPIDRQTPKPAPQPGVEQPSSRVTADALMAISTFVERWMPTFITASVALIGLAVMAQLAHARRLSRRKQRVLYSSSLSDHRAPRQDGRRFDAQSSEVMRSPYLTRSRLRNSSA